MDQGMGGRSGAEWLAARFNAITATDVGKILGCDSTTSRKKLFESKVMKIDPLADASSRTKEFLLLGRQFEPVACEAFMRWGYEQGEIDGYIPGMTPHRVIPWLTGTPDWIARYWLAPKNPPMVVEFKTHFYPTITEARPIADVSALPLKYWLQLQIYLEIMDYQVGLLWSWTVSHGHTCFRVTRDREFFNTAILPILEWFWDRFSKVKDRPGSSDYLTAVASMKFHPREKHKLVELVQAAMENSTVKLETLSRRET